MICDSPDMERVFLAHRDTKKGALNFWRTSTFLVHRVTKKGAQNFWRTSTPLNDAVHVGVEVHALTDDCD